MEFHKRTGKRGFCTAAVADLNVTRKIKQAAMPPKKGFTGNRINKIKNHTIDKQVIRKTQETRRKFQEETSERGREGGLIVLCYRGETPTIGGKFRSGQWAGEDGGEEE